MTSLALWIAYLALEISYLQKKRIHMNEPSQILHLCLTSQSWMYHTKYSALFFYWHFCYPQKLSLIVIYVIDWKMVICKILNRRLSLNLLSLNRDQTVKPRFRSCTLKMHSIYFYKSPYVAEISSEIWVGNSSWYSCQNIYIYLTCKNFDKLSI